MLQTRMGRLAVGGDGVALVFLAIFIGFAVGGQTGGDTFFSNPWLAVPILLAGGAAIAAGIVGLICILTHRERSLPVIATVILGAIVLAWTIVEIAIPH